MSNYPRSNFPAELFPPLLRQVAQDNLALQRRVTALNILWQERYLTRSQLMVRIETQVGRGCFGQQPVLAFARDIRFVREVLKEHGLVLRYQRRKGQTGYYVPTRPEFPRALANKIQATVQELHPEQTRMYAHLAPAERVRQGADLAEIILAQAASRLRKEKPALSTLEARRKALSRMYTLEKLDL